MLKEKDFYQISLKVILKNNRGEILVLKAADGGTYAGYYDLPGGRIDADEFTLGLSEIVRREVREEVGVVEFKLNAKPVAVGRHLIPATLSGNGRDIHVLYLFFEADYLGGEVTISSEHTGLAWLNLAEIKPEKYFTSGILEGVRMYLA